MIEEVPGQGLVAGAGTQPWKPVVTCQGLAPPEFIRFSHPGFMQIAWALPHDPGRSLTAVVVELAPGAKAASHRHASTVFAYVLEGTVRPQLNGGEVIESHAGQSWVEPPGATHTLTENPTVLPARLLAVFVVATGVPLTTYEQ